MPIPGWFQFEEHDVFCPVEFTHEGGRTKVLFKPDNEMIRQATDFFHALAPEEILLPPPELKQDDRVEVIRDQAHGPAVGAKGQLTSERMASGKHWVMFTEMCMSCQNRGTIYIFIT